MTRSSGCIRFTTNLFAMRLIGTTIAMMAIGLALFAGAAQAQPVNHPDPRVYQLWPQIDFSTALVPLGEIIAGGVPVDGIPPVYNPRYERLNQAGLTDQEPVITVEIGGEVRAYPLRYMTAHEIVNDTLGGVPVVVTYCPLCNTAMVFDRRVDGRAFTFGVSGLLRHSDLIMWDHETESLWQQFEARAIAGTSAGKLLDRLPSRMESVAELRRRHGDDIEVLAPPRGRGNYGRNPYVGYDQPERRPFLYRGELPEGIPPMQRVVVVGERAWKLDDLADAGVFEDAGLRFTVTHEQASALDAARIDEGRLVPGVVVEERDGSSNWRDVPHEVTFAFVFHAFHPDGEWR
jgi:hypothetical protein